MITYEEKVLCSAGAAMHDAVRRLRQGKSGNSYGQDRMVAERRSERGPQLCVFSDEYGITLVYLMAVILTTITFSHFLYTLIVNDLL